MMNLRKTRFFCIVLALLFLAPLTTQAQAPTPDPRFGIVEAYVNAAEATAAGAGYTRIILRWDVVQPAGRDDWKPANVPDPFIEAELAAGREVVAVLIGTPTWASNGINDSRAVPDMDAWGNFTKRMAQQYQGRIKHWVIWNEPDVWDLEHRGGTWLGTEEDYVQLLKTAYQNIKSVDPSMEVHLTGLTYHWDAEYDREQYLARLLRAIAADPQAAEYNYFFDAVVYHLYYNPPQMFGILQEVRSMLDIHGLGYKPIWVNETNAPPTDDPLEPPWAEPLLVVSSEEQAAFVPQAFALLIAGGAERIEFYKLRNSADHPEDVEPFGMLRHDDSRRLAFDAYKAVTTHFAGYIDSSWYQQGAIYVVTLDRGERTTTVLWNTDRQARNFTLNAIAPEAILVDELGNETPLSAVGGTYTVDLPGATCSAGFCFIGGAPRMLVEAGSPAQRASLIPLATETPTPTPEPTAPPEPTLTPTPEPSPSATDTPQPSPTTTATSTPAGDDVTTQNNSPADSNPATPESGGGSIASADLGTQVPNLSQGEAAQTITPTAIPTLAPTGLQLAESFTPSRLLFLVVLGAILFTVIYVIQHKIWTDRR